MDKVLGKAKAILTIISPAQDQEKLRLSILTAGLRNLHLSGIGGLCKKLV